uniref:Solute carrier family 29 member 2 n=1 Tax=Sinocyclocheilus rhinocerous TaxID=307959 RepID=A0A673KB10_9TELE
MRIAGSMVFILLLFILTAILVKVKMDQDHFFSITMATIWFINMFGAVLQGSLFGLVGNGQAVAGIFSGIAMLLSNIFETDSDSSALGYFITPCVATLLTLCCYLPCTSRFTQLHLENVSTKTTMKKPSANSSELVKVKLNHFDNGFDDIGETEACKKLNELKQEPTEKSTVPQVFKKIWVMALCVTCVFAVTLSVFPAITINTKPSGLFDGKDNIFVPVCSFIVFNVMDWIGRSLTSRLQWPSMKSHSFPFFVVLWVVFIPALMLCNIQPRFYLPVFFNHDMAYIIIMSLFAMTNGYFACLSMSYAPQLVRPKDAETAGALMTFFLALGLSLGAGRSHRLTLLLSHYPTNINKFQITIILRLRYTFPLFSSLYLVHS